MIENSEVVIVILRQEYAIAEGEAKIVAPSAKNGTILILSDKTKTAMAHVDSEAESEEYLATIISNLENSGCDIASLSANLMGKEIYPLLKEALKKRGIKFDEETWSGNHVYMVEVNAKGIISVTNDAVRVREIYNSLLFNKEQDGEGRLNRAMSNVPIIFVRITNEQPSPDVKGAKQQLTFDFPKSKTL